MATGYTIGADTWGKAWWNDWCGQTFHVQAPVTLTLVKVYVSRPHPRSEIRINVYYANADHEPWGDVLAAVVITNDDFPTGQDEAWITKQLSNPINAIPAEYFVITVEATTWYQVQAQWAYDAGDATYPYGIRISTDDNGLSFTKHYNDDHMFYIWGTPPSPPPPPVPPATKWAALNISQDLIPGGYRITLTTDVPCHLSLYWTDQEPWVHPVGDIRRGLAVPWDAYWCFVSWTLIEQEEPGDTITHTFIWPGWVSCQTKYFRFHGTIGGEDSASDSPIFRKHYPFLPPGGAEILYPISDTAVYCGLFPNTGEEHWEDVDDRYPDDDATYIYATNTYKTDEYGLTQLPGEPRVHGAVMLTAACRKTAPTAIANVRLGIITHANNYYADPQFLTEVYTAYSNIWPVNPFTGNPWTTMELNDLQAHIRLIGGAAPIQGRCTQLFITVA